LNSSATAELRTPLSAIKGYAETIGGLDEVNTQYLEVIKKHTDRLINIVKDLLVLSELEEAPQKMEFEEIDLCSLVEQVIKMFERKVVEKELKIIMNFEKNLPPLSGDYLKMEQVFINLL